MICSVLALKKPASRLMAKPVLSVGIAKVVTFFESANFRSKYFQKFRIFLML
jgi:hypothetical protein